MTTIVIANTLKRAKLLTRKTGKTAVYPRHGFIKIVMPLVGGNNIVWDLLRTFTFYKTIKIYKKRRGDVTNRIIVISILKANESRGLWHFLFSHRGDGVYNFEWRKNKNGEVRGMRKRRRMLRGGEENATAVL